MSTFITTKKVTKTMKSPILGKTVFFGDESLGITVNKIPCIEYPYALHFGQDPKVRSMYDRQTASADTIGKLGAALVELSKVLKNE